MRLTAQQVYDKLINEDKILELQGQIRFFFGDVDIIVKQKDVVGNIIQEWLQGWLDKRGIEYAPSENTQMPPDFFLNPDDRTRDLLGQYRTIKAHALLEAISVMLHKNSLTCDSKPAKFLYNLTKNLTAQSAHLNCAVSP